MAGWTETYRGAVNAWETDVVDHFTVAFYFDRFSDSTLALMDELELGQAYREGGLSFATVDCHVRYLEELRAGDVLHIESALIGVDERGLKLGHKVFNSETGGLCATLEQYVLHFDMKARKAVRLNSEQRRRLAAVVIAWDGEPREERWSPEHSDGFVATYRDTAKPWEIDVNGHVGFQFLIHRFSAATIQALNGIGLTPGHFRQGGYGFSTFEFQLRFRRELHAGDAVAIRSGIMHVGRSSVRVLNRMFNLRTGELAAELSQFGVNLDMAARRPAAFPDAVREKAAALLIAPPAA